MKVPVRAGGHVVGHHDGSTFFRTFHPSKHVLREPSPSLAVDVGVLGELERAGVTACQFTDSTTGDAYVAPLVAFWEHGFLVDRGFGAQRALPLLAFFHVSTSQPWLPGLDAVDVSS